MIRWGRAKRRAWERRSRREQVEASTRWMLFCSPWIFYCSGILQIVVGVERRPLPLALAAAVTVFGLVLCVLGVGGLRQGLDFYLEAAPAPTRRLRIMTGVAVLPLAALTALVASDHITIPSAPAMVLFATLPTLLNIYGLLVPPRRAAKVATLWSVAVVVLLGLAGMPWPGLVVTLFVAVVASFIGTFTTRSSGWYIAVMRELEDAKEAQALLAVAEERLRFSRDLHDVMGRNLSVIALKSELATQLARRGAASAVEQMAEVQRIARESQTEVRAVVRGYREAGLHNELAGARGVLRAAGVDCRIEESGAELPRGVQAALGWVVREGATNVLRHADASHCLIRVGAQGRPGAGRAVLVMENDGVRGSGSGSGAEGGLGSGLTGLRERLAALGGTLTVERAADSAGTGGDSGGAVADGGGSAFRLRAEIPLVPEDGERGPEPAAAAYGPPVGAGAPDEVASAEGVSVGVEEEELSGAHSRTAR